MKAMSFSGATHEEAQKEFDQWRKKNLAVALKNYAVSEETSPQRFQRKLDSKRTLVTISFEFDDQS